MTEQEFIKNCKEKGLTDTQAEHCLELYKYCEDIKWSFEKAKLDFNEYQMYEAQFALQKGLNKEQVEFFYKPEFNAHQMSEARIAFQNGLTKGYPGLLHLFPVKPWFVEYFYLLFG